MFDISLQELLMRVMSGLVILALHGYIQAWTAFRLGDSTPKEEGRVTFNPMTHLSWLGFISYIISLKGWGKAIWLDLERFPKHSNLAWVALAGWLGLLGLALLAIGLRPVLAFEVALLLLTASGWIEGVLRPVHGEILTSVGWKLGLGDRLESCAMIS